MISNDILTNRPQPIRGEAVSETSFYILFFFSFFGGAQSRAWDIRFPAQGAMHIYPYFHVLCALAEPSLGVGFSKPYTPESLHPHCSV